MIYFYMPCRTLVTSSVINACSFERKRSTENTTRLDSQVAGARLGALAAFCLLLTALGQTGQGHEVGVLTWVWGGRGCGRRIKANLMTRQVSRSDDKKSEKSQGAERAGDRTPL